MKIKYNKSPIYNIMLFVTMIMSGIFNIISLPVLSNTNMQYNILFVIAIALFFNSIINKKINLTVKTYSLFFYSFMIYVALFVLVHSFYSVIEYNEGMRSIYATAKFFVYLILFIPYIYVIHINNGYEQLLKNIAVITLTVLAFKTLKAFAFDFAGISILGSITSGIRYGRLRISASVFTPLTFIFYVNKLLTTKINKKKYYVYLAIIAFILFYILFINMTRMNIIGYILTLTIMILVKKRPKNKQLVVIVSVAFLAAVLLSTNTFDSFVSSFSETDAELGSSALARNLANEYFKQFPKDNPVLSLSFLCPDTPLRNAVFFGPYGTYCLDDLGLKNMYYHYGISGIIMAVLLLGRLIFIALSVIFSNSKNKLIITGITVFIAFTQPSLCIFDGQRILSLIIYWAIFEYEYSKIKHHKEKFSVKNILSKRGNSIEQQQQ